NIILDTGNAIANDTWYFVAGVADITNSQRTLYIYDTGGTLVGTATDIFTGTWGTDNGVASIGGETNSGETDNRFFGNIDEVRVYNAALSSGQLALIMAEHHPSPAPAPLANYAMDEDTWGTIIDSSGNGYDASALGSATPDPYPVTVPPGEAIAGDPGTCGAGLIPATFGTQAVSSPVEPDATVGNSGSIAFWYNGNANWDDGTDRMLFDASNNLGNNDADKHFYLVKRGGGGLNNGSLRFAIEDSGDTNSTATTGQFTFAA